jgi:hypothetical protein
MIGGEARSHSQTKFGQKYCGKKTENVGLCEKIVLAASEKRGKIKSVGQKSPYWDLASISLLTQKFSKFFGVQQPQKTPKN